MIFNVVLFFPVNRTQCTGVSGVYIMPAAAAAKWPCTGTVCVDVDVKTLFIC